MLWVLTSQRQSQRRPAIGTPEVRYKCHMTFSHQRQSSKIQRKARYLKNINKCGTSRSGKLPPRQPTPTGVSQMHFKCIDHSSRRARWPVRALSPPCRCSKAASSSMFGFAGSWPESLSHAMLDPTPAHCSHCSCRKITRL